MSRLLSQQGLRHPRNPVSFLGGTVSKLTGVDGGSTGCNISLKMLRRQDEEEGLIGR